jgi:hypothetical protein
MSIKEDSKDEGMLKREMKLWENDVCDRETESKRERETQACIF